jgi:hypothetical protein
LFPVATLPHCTASCLPSVLHALFYETGDASPRPPGRAAGPSQTYPHCSDAGPREADPPRWFQRLGRCSRSRHGQATSRRADPARSRQVPLLELSPTRWRSPISRKRRRSGSGDCSTSRMISSFSAAGYLMRRAPQPRACFFQQPVLEHQFGHHFLQRTGLPA